MARGRRGAGATTVCVNDAGYLAQGKRRSGRGRLPLRSKRADRRAPGMRCRVRRRGQFANLAPQGIRHEGEIGTGEGNRTHVVSLGSFCSTIELRPRNRSGIYPDSANRQALGKRVAAISVDILGIAQESDRGRSCRRPRKEWFRSSSFPGPARPFGGRGPAASASVRARI